MPGGHSETRKGRLSPNVGTGNKVWFKLAGASGLTPLIFLCWTLWDFWHAWSQGRQFLHFTGAYWSPDSRDTSLYLYRLPLVIIMKVGPLLMLPGIYCTDHSEHRSAGHRGTESIWRGAQRDLSLWFVCCPRDWEKVFLVVFLSCCLSPSLSYLGS